MSSSTIFRSKYDPEEDAYVPCEIQALEALHAQEGSKQLAALSRCWIVPPLITDMEWVRKTYSGQSVAPCTTPIAKSAPSKTVAASTAVPSATPVAPPGAFSNPTGIEVFYDHQKKNYLRRDVSGNWIGITEKSLGYHLQTKYRVGKKLIPRRIHDIQSSNAIFHAGPLAGVNQGARIVHGKLVLVTESPVLLKPVPGEWPMLSALLEGLLNDPIQDQRPYLHGWLKVGLEALYNGVVRPGQVLAIAGPANCGKSLLQALFTVLLGNRVGRPYQFMTGQTPFNADLFSAEHLIIEDDDPRTDLAARRSLGTAIKTFSVNSTQRCHAKGKDALVLEPFWRMSITMNDEEENVMLLPPFDSSIVDKIILLRAKSFAMPMPTTEMEDRKLFWQVLVNELPHYIHYLFNAHKIDPELASSRFGITHYHNPVLLDMLDGASPENKLLRLIDTHVLSGGLRRWEGSAEDLETVLFSSSSAKITASRLLGWTNATGTYLGRLASKLPHRVKHVPGRKGGHRSWILISESTTVTAPPPRAVTDDDIPF